MYQADRLETQQYIQDVFETADNTISVRERKISPIDSYDPIQKALYIQGWFCFGRRST